MRTVTLMMIMLFAQNKTKRYVPEEQKHPPSNKKHHLPFGKECEASLDSAYFSTTRDDGNAHSNSSEIPDDLEHGYEREAHVIANDVEFGIQETDYCQNDTYTAWQLTAVDKCTLLLDRNASQSAKPISCSDVSEETSNQCQVKVDNLSTRYSRSQQPSVCNSSETLDNTPPLPRQHKPSGKTKISGHQVVTGCHQQPLCDANQEEDTTTLNNQSTTGNIGEQTASAGHTQEDHRPDPFKFTSVIVPLPEPLGIACVLDFVDFNVSESHIIIKYH